MNDFTEKNFIQREIERTLDNCTYCGECVMRCDIFPFLKLNENKPSKVVKKKHVFLETGQADEDIKKLIFSCSMCGKCSLVCPESLSPHFVMLGLRIKWREAGREFPPIMKKVLPQNQFSYSKLVEALTLKSSEVDIIRDVQLNPPSSEQILYLGCQLMPRADILLTLLDIMSLIGFKGIVLSGPDLCCGYLNLMGGDLATSEKMCKKLINAFQRFKAKEVVFWCSDCYRRIKEYSAASNNKPNFKLTYLVEFLADNVEKWQFKKPIKDIVTYHDPCPLCFDSIFDPPREIIKCIPGLEFHEMERNRENSICCSGNASRLMPQVSQRLTEQRVIEATKTGAKKLLTSCYGCERRFTDFVGGKYGITYPHLIMLIAEGHRIYHENVWEKLSTSKDVKYIIERCKNAIEESPFNEDDIRRELPQYL